MDNYYKGINGILIASIITMFFMIAQNSYQWYDDFYYIESIENIGVFKHAFGTYFGWDGRGISPISMLISYMISNLSAVQMVIIAVLALISCGYCIYQIAIRNIQYGIAESIIHVLLVVVLLWMVFRPHLSRSVFWSTGSFYIYSNLVLLIGVLSINRSNTKHWILLLITIVIGLSGINSAMGYFTFVCLMGIHTYYYDKKIPAKYFISIVVLFVCMSISVLAPGNLIRVQSEGGQLDFQLINAPYNFLMVLKEYFLMSKWAVVGSIVFGVAYGYTSFFQRNKQDLILAAFYLLSALATIIPFIPLPLNASKHTAIFFQSFLFLSLILVAVYLVSYVPKNWQDKLKWIVPFVLVYILVNVIEQYQLGKEIKPLVIKRHEYLESIRNNPDTVYIDRINQPDHFYTNRFFEISEDPSHANNKGLQGIFNTGPVILKPE